MRLWVLLTAATVLAVAGCAPRADPFDGPRPGPSLHMSAPFEPPGVRPAPAPIGIGLPQVHRVMPRPKCKIKTKTVVNNGVKRVNRYQVCK